MKFIVIILVLIIIGVGGYFFLAGNYQSPKPASDQPVSCITGVNGNSGDNYCSNYHQSASKCLPHTDNTYPDGCTK